MPTLTEAKHVRAPIAVALVCVCLALAGCGLFGGRGSVAAGQKALDAGKYRVAYIEATKVLRHDEKNGEAWLLLGKASLMLGNPRDALGELQHAESNGIPAARRVLPTAEAMLVSGQFDKLLAGVKPDPAFGNAVNVQIDAIRGDAFRGIKQSDNATAAYDAALKLDPSDARALVGSARLAAAAGDSTRAGLLVQQALAAKPDDPRAWVAKGDLAFEVGKFAPAEADFQKALNAPESSWLPQESFYARARLADAQTHQNKLDAALANITKLEKLSKDQPYPHYLHAVVLYKQDQLDAAISQLQTVLQYSPDDVPSQMLLGAVNFAQRNYGQAEMYFSNVIGVDPQNVAARRLLSLAYFRAGNVKLATSTLRSTVSGNPTDDALLAMLQRASSAGSGAQAGGSPERELAAAGQALESGAESEAMKALQSGAAQGGSVEERTVVASVLGDLRARNTDNALKTASAFAAKHQQDVSAHLLYGTVLVSAGKRADARAQYEQALKLDPKNIPVLLSLGSLDSLDGKPKDAEARFNAALAVDAHSIAAMTALGHLAEAQGDLPKAIDWFKRAIDANPKAPAPRAALIALYGTSGKFDEAMASAKSWVGAVPDDAAALNALGATELNAGHVEDALKSLQQAAQLAPATTLYRLNLARAQIAGKNDKAAEDNLGKVVKADPAQVQAVAMLAFVKLHAGDLKGALAQAQALQQQPATKAVGFTLEGDLYATSKSWAEAVQAYQQAMQIEPNRTLVIKTFLSQVHAGSKSPEGVLVDWLSQHHDDAGTRLMLAQYYLTAGQAPSAAGQYEAVLKAHPDDITALNNLAWLYTESRNPKAVDLAAKVYKLSPASPNVQDTYGWALVSANRLDEAIPLLAKAARAAPDATAIQYHLAVAESRAGNKVAARSTLNALLKLKESFPERAAAEKLMADLGGNTGG